MITYAFYKESKDATKDEDVSVHFRISNAPLVLGPASFCFGLTHPRPKMPLKIMGTLANPTVSVQSLMQGIDLRIVLPIQCTCRTGVSWVFFFNRGSGLPPGPSCKVARLGPVGCRGGVASGYWAVCNITSNNNQRSSCIAPRGIKNASHSLRNTSSSLCDALC